MGLKKVGFIGFRWVSFICKLSFQSATAYTYNNIVMVRHLLFSTYLSPSLGRNYPTDYSLDQTFNSSIVT